MASAIAACHKRFGRTYSSNQVFVVGDTPSDVQADHANHVRPLAVVTGHYSSDELIKHNPSYLVQDLADSAEVIELLLDH